MNHDNPALHEAAQEAASSLKSADSHSEEEEVTEVVEAEADGEEKPSEAEPEKKAKTSKPETTNLDTETDLEKIDPESLPEELRPLYKNLMKGFTQGRQKDSEAKRAAEEKAAELEARLKQFEASQNQVRELSPGEIARLNPYEQAKYFSWLADKRAKDTVQQERIDSYREQALNDYPTLDPRLNEKGEGYDSWMDKNIGAALDERLAEHVKIHGSELGFDYKSHAKELIEEWDNYLEGTHKSYIERQNKIAKEAVEKAKKLTPKTSSANSSPNKKMSVREAIQAAKDKLNN